MNVLHKNTVGILFVTIGLLVTCNIYSLIPLYTTIANEMDIVAKDVATGSILFTLFYAFGLLVFSPLADSFGRRRIILIGLFVSAITTLLVSFAKTPLPLYIFRGIQGFSLASFAPVAFAFSFDIFMEKERTFWIALINAGFLAAGMIGQLTSAFILQISTWQHVYYFFSAVYLLLFFLGIFILPKVVNHHSKESVKGIISQFIKLLRGKILSKYYSIVFTLLFSFVAYYEALGYFLPQGDLKVLIQSIGLLGVFLSVFAGTFISYFSARNTLLIGILLGIGSMILLLFSYSPWFTAFLSIFFVASIALLIPTIIHLIGTNSGVYRGKALCLYSFLLLIGASLGSFVASILSYRMVLILLIFTFMHNFFVTWKLKRIS
ncbi:MFS transporter [Caldibacillus lycopersici]|uniref:MFS transporter n=1 Tax=Perspicuibacillus lycopersici TaxID=1325689 RepID=A0AAE3IUW6_9BACI|nr:MFS transporter [Perspicuibacillus lycopersici]MCU9612480.1 MFS transporter [Perspicuibacillus lycopersici]